MSVEVEYVGQIEDLGVDIVDFVMPAEIEDWYNRVKRTADILDQDVERTKCLPQNEYNAWKRWYADFNASYKDFFNRSWFYRWSLSAYDVAEQWRKEVVAWREKVRKACDIVPSGAEPVAPPTDVLRETLVSFKPIAMWIGIPVALYFGYKLINRFLPAKAYRPKKRKSFSGLSYTPKLRKKYDPEGVLFSKYYEECFKRTGKRSTRAVVNKCSREASRKRDAAIRKAEINE